MNSAEPASLSLIATDPAWKLLPRLADEAVNAAYDVCHTSNPLTSTPETMAAGTAIRRRVAARMDGSSRDRAGHP
ncbi:hypothetical protein Kisp02_21130 [Kineosporia sp. NBRC 101731]|nr:hypothetical protein Kisp02_21130 [Kineosporia sp. NBRC 101731]